MGFLSIIYNELLWRPLFNGLVFFYTFIPPQDLGIAIVLLTVLIRVILTPLLWKAKKSQEDLVKIQPEIKRIQGELKENREAQSKALMELYSKHRVNPFTGCLLMLVQLPILIALFQVFNSGLNNDFLSYLYSFIPSPGSINPLGFGFLDLSKGNIYLGFIAAATQYFQTKLMMVPTPQGKDDFASAFQKQALYVFPIMILVTSYTLPAAMALYWTVLNVFGILQDIITKKLSTKSVS